ncbi:IclR family transcriptional regulator [Aeromicrobium sp. CTD01-1L150]|uniref:IclR family transcriptional regulator n=1 Tax=Aeromicrobium sp. CTD01-1L150 TaxID=3341830 RepID=UPI0035BFF2C6
MSEETRPAPQQSALIKGLRVLEIVATHDRLSDIAATAGLSNSTVHRILSDLVAHGWVHQDEDRRYHPGPRPSGLASLLERPDDYLQHVIPHLRTLRDQTGYTVHFAVRRGKQLTYTVKVDGAGSARMRSYVGMELPLHSTAIGKAVLSTMNSHQVVETLAGTPVRRLTERTVVTRPQLFDQLAVASERGWALDDGENELHTRCVGVAIPQGGDQAVGGLSMSGLGRELGPDQIAALAPAVVATGQAVSQTLAALPRPTPATAG